ncbi:MAG TPA: 2-hydroxyhepta-2,4-diene-1,7-dioate isomerase [Rhodobacteraceae bacterium]|nr:2-hydroxyhepta-2,4-diene-1,7-dioate isomerase [Paracoccaceae bacterium]
MKLASYSVGNDPFWGAVAEGGMVALSPDFPGWPSLREVIAAGALRQVAATAKGRPVTHATGTFRWEIPIPAPEKIICVGVNYPDRNAEYKDGTTTAPPNPSLFVRFARSFVGHAEALIRPRESEQLDYEGEIVIVIGREGRRIAQSDAWDHIAAISLANEGTVRDWVRHAKFNVTQGKNFDASGALGPWLVPFENRSQLEDIALETRVNGEVRQVDRTARMIFPFPKIVEYVSTFTTLVPGDVILCGTPTGAGARLAPPVWLKPGDVVEVSAEGIGTLINSIGEDG